MRRLLLLLVLAAACRTAPVPLPAPGAVDLAPPGLRLPDSVRPLAYALDLRVVPGEDTFSGEVRIEVELLRPTDVVWLHARGPKAETAQVTFGGEAVVAVPRAVGPQHLALVLPRPLGPGQAQLQVRYQGPLSRKDTAGLFQLREGGLDYAFTHFEPLDARRAWPCFDEPQHKVPWQLTLRVKQEHLALFNTAALDEASAPGGMKVVRFEPTRPLPSYLVALAVGPFERVDAGARGRGRTPTGIVVPKGKAREAAWAVEVTGPVLERLEDYFGIPYGYQKLDHIALPTPTGAMENPGLITYGQQRILARPEEDTPARQRGFAGLTTHEQAHLWFGDLVTLAWWDDLWLNEAFATWMTPRLLAEWKPDWGLELDLVARRSAALGTDGLVAARRIRQPIVSEDDVRNAFDGVTYGKGASVISMFERWVGPEVFQRGVRRYLDAHAHRSATTADFLAALSHAAGRDVATPFSSFLDQPGAPRVAARLRCEGGAPPRLELRQRRWLPWGSKGDDGQRWEVPVCARWSAQGKEGRACTLLASERGELRLDGAAACPDWVLPNDGMLGYYRTSLEGPGGLLGLLERAGARLTAAERVGLLGDLGALVASGEVDLGDALRVVAPALEGGNRHLVQQAQGLAGALHEEMVPRALQPKHQRWLRDTFGPLARSLGMQVRKTDSEDQRLLRPGLLVLVGRDGKDEPLRAEALRLARAWLKDRAAVHPDLVDAVLAVAADVGDAELHAALLAAAKAEPDRSDRGHLLGALAAFRRKDLVERALPLVLGPELDAREAAGLLWGASRHHLTRDLALDFVERHWDALLARLPGDSGAGLVWLAAGSCDAARRERARTFFNGRSTQYLGGPRSFALALEVVDLCIAFRERQRPSALAFLEAWAPRAP